MADNINYTGFKLDIGEISILTFNQPKINIFSTEVLNSLVKAMDTLYSSSDVKVLVITSEGKNFLAGANIKEMFAFSPKEANQFSQLFHKAMNLVENFPGPVIAAVNGFALGGGCELILACDMVVASETAVFGQPEVNLGIIPGAGGTQRLAERIGNLHAKELIMTGRNVLADEALTLGLINKVVPKDNLIDATMEMAKTIASKPGYCIAAAKLLVDSGTMEEEIALFSEMFSRKERKALMGKFIKK
ncbi:MAG: enoyl-CoA hydratase/isomerase family protein [Candidatus Anammoxibacter sp.]